MLDAVALALALALVRVDWRQTQRMKFEFLSLSGDRGFVDTLPVRDSAHPVVVVNCPTIHCTFAMIELELDFTP
jgi:hypothetical protein